LILPINRGGARSEVWTQMFADTLEVLIEVPDGIETGARGAAIAAGIGAGVYANFTEAVEQAVSVVRSTSLTGSIRPSTGPLEEYKRLLGAMREPWIVWPIWRRHKALGPRKNESNEKREIFALH